MDREIQLIPLPEGFDGRVEKGPVQFGEDWPGTFIRGDNAVWYAMSMRDLGSSNLRNRAPKS